MEPDELPSESPKPGNALKIGCAIILLGLLAIGVLIFLISLYVSWVFNSIEPEYGIEVAVIVLMFSVAIILAVFNFFFG